MTKKKLLSLCMVGALAGTAVVGGSLAYFTDKDAETNTFTVGNIDIDLKEEFPDPELMPGMDVKKEAWITNEGDNDAWVWAEVLIPKAIDDGIKNSPDAPGADNSLHVNYPGAFADGYAQNKDSNGKYYNEDMSDLWIHQYNEDGIEYGFVATEKIGDVEYNKYIKFFTEKLDGVTKDDEGNEIVDATSLFLSQVYMDSKIKQCTDENHDENCLVLTDGSHYTGTWKVIVRAYGIQAAGFDNVIDAWKAYDGEK